MDRIHDSEMNADARELAALRKSVDEVKNNMKADLARHLADSARSDKQLIVGLALVFGLVSFHLVTENLAPSPGVTITDCGGKIDVFGTPTIHAAPTIPTAPAVPVDTFEAQRRDRDILGASSIRRVLDDSPTSTRTKIDPACLTLVTADWPDLTFDEVVEACSKDDQ